MFQLGAAQDDSIRSNAPSCRSRIEHHQQSCVRCKDRTISHAVDLCIGKSPTLPSHSIGSRSHDAVFRVYDDAGNVIETHEHKGQFKER